MTWFKKPAPAERVATELRDRGVRLALPAAHAPKAGDRHAETDVPARAAQPAAVAPVFELLRLSKFHDGPAGVRVFERVDASAPPEARLLGLEGPSGAGKTTLLNLLAGLDVPTSGVVRVLGVALAGELRALATHRRRVGYVLQSKNLVDHLSARDNVAMPLLLHGMPRSAALGHAEYWLEALGLRDCARRKPARLSGGQQQRAAIARALASRAKLILADEPTSALDEASAKQVLRALGQAAHEFDVAVVLASHDPQALATCDRVLRCAGGGVELLPRESTVNPKAEARAARQKARRHDPLFPGGSQG